MGRLLLIPTPIGNLQDITLRSIEALRTVDGLLAEDTRVTGRLLQHLNIQVPMTAFHQANEHKVLDKVIGRLQNGETLGMVTDAGTPGISDPGFLLVRAAIAANIAVECLPGPTAIIPALVVSGLPNDRFCFEGFLPHKKGRQTKLQALSTEERTMVFYESPHRLLKTLTQMADHFGADRSASVSREISKLFEETIRGTLAEIIAHFQTHPIKGEFVVVVGGAK